MPGATEPGAGSKSPSAMVFRVAKTSLTREAQADARESMTTRFASLMSSTIIWAE